MEMKNKITTVLILLACLFMSGSAFYEAHCGEAGDGESVVCVADEGGIVEKPKIAITFDDGPDPVYTEKLLDGLKARGAKASFFLMGKQAEAYPELVLRMQKEGHLIGNHTYSHLQLKDDDKEAFIAEVKKTNELLFQITGQEVEYVRPPYGSWDKNFESEFMMIPVLWTIDPKDWCSDNVAEIVQKVTDEAEENAIILMHDEYESSVEAALEIVDTLQKQGYEFVTVEELFLD